MKQFSLTCLLVMNVAIGEIGSVPKITTFLVKVQEIIYEELVYYTTK